MIRRKTATSALLIGIGYENNRDYTRLETSHRDTYAMKDLLITTYKLKEANIHALVDDGKHQRPTKTAIEAAIQDFVRRAKEGELLFFYYNGHGDQKQCNDPREDDGFDEALVPCDATEDGETWIVDNFLKETLVKKLPVNAQLIAVFDMCHSGTALDLPHYDCYRHELERASSFKAFCRRRGSALRSFQSSESRLSRRSLRTSEERSIRSEKRVVISESSPRPISILSQASDTTVQTENSNLRVQIDDRPVQLNHAPPRVDLEKLYIPHPPIQSISQAISASIRSGEDSAVSEDTASHPVPGCFSPASSSIRALSKSIYRSLSRRFGSKGNVKKTVASEASHSTLSSHSRHAISDSQSPLIATRGFHHGNYSPMKQSPWSLSSPALFQTSAMDEVFRTAHGASSNQCESPTSASFSCVSPLDMHHHYLQLQQQPLPQAQRKLSGSESGSHDTAHRTAPRAPGRGYTFPKDAHHAYIARPEDEQVNDMRAKPKRKMTDWRRSCTHGDDDTLLWGQVISIGASRDSQLTFEQTQGEMSTFTRILIKYLQNNPHPTYKQLMLGVRRQIHKISDDLYKVARDMESKGVLGEEAANFVNTVKCGVAESKTGHLQEPELSSARFMNIGTTCFMK